MADDAERVAPKRTRTGETFLSPADVTLHASDFAFEDLLDAPLEGPAAAVVTAAGGPATAVRTLRDLHDLHVQLTSALLQDAVTAVSGAGPDTNGIRGAPSPAAASTESPAISDPPVSSPPVAPPNSFGGSSPWETHYVRTRNNFFPIKNYIHRAFPTLLGPLPADDPTAPTAPVSSDGAGRVVMECGCGSGSAVLPLMRFGGRADRFVCFDISPTAVDLLRSNAVCRQFCQAHPLGDAAFHGFALDIGAVGADLPAAVGGAIAPGSVDHLLLIFVLCALDGVPAMRRALCRLRPWLRPGRFAPDGAWHGGRFHFRDYALLDHNMMRFLARPQSAASGAAAPSTGVAAPPSADPSASILFFEKGDRTTQFFFGKAFTAALFASCGFVPISVEYHCNEVRNRGTGQAMRKVFINAEFGVLEEEQSR